MNMDMSEEDYMRTRVDDQIDWYNKNSALNKNCHVGLIASAIILSAAIPVASMFIDRNESGHEVFTYVTGLIGVMGAIVAIVTALSTLMKFHEKWIKYRTTCEQLTREKHLYLTNTSSYDDSSKFNYFVERVEAILSDENQGWRQIVKK